MNSSSYFSWARDFLVPCNRTELYQICRRNGLEVLPGTPRDEMIDYIIGAKEPPAVGHPIDGWRHAIMEVIIEHKDVVVASLNCPAKTLDPRACFQCPDTQVISCLIQNKNDEPIIAAKRIVRTNRKDSIMTAPVAQPHLTIENAPRDLASLQGKSGYRLNALARELAAKVNPHTHQPFLISPTDPSPEAKAVWAAFTSGKPETGAPVVLEALRRHDQVFGTPAGAGGGIATPTPAAMPQPMATPQPMPVAIPTGPQAVMPSAIPGAAPMPLPAAAAAAMPQPMAAPPGTAPTPEAAPAAKGGRTPKNTSSASIEEIKALTDRLDRLEAMLGTLIEFAKAGDARLVGIEALARGNVKGMTYSLATSLLMAEALLQDTQESIANFAAQSAPNIGAFFEPAEGKAIG